MVAALFAWGWALDFSLILEISHLTSFPYFGLIFPIGIKKENKNFIGRCLL